MKFYRLLKADNRDMKIRQYRWGSDCPLAVPVSGLETTKPALSKWATRYKALLRSVSGLHPRSMEN